MKDKPRLTKEGEEQAQEILNDFKDKLINSANDALSDFYVDFTSYIESDSWDNMYTNILNSIIGYSEHKLRKPYEAKRIRERIFIQYRKEITNDIILDLQKEIQDLKVELDDLRLRS